MPSTPTVYSATLNGNLSGPLYGNADPDTTVQIWHGGTLLTSVRTLAQGFWHTPSSYAFPDGHYEVTVVSVDDEGNTSPPAPIYRFTVDDVGPAAPTIQIEFYGTPGTPTHFYGRADPGALVTLSMDGSPIATAVADVSGNWKARFVIGEGRHKIWATAQDATNEVSEKSTTFDFIHQPEVIQPPPVVQPPVVVEPPPPSNDDFSSDISRAGALVPGKETRGSIDYEYDSDAFKVRLDGLTAYRFSVRGSESGGGTVPASDLRLSLWKPVGTNAAPDYVALEYSHTPTGTLVLDAAIADAGDYYLSVDSSSTLGTYTVQAAMVARDDHHNDPGRASAIQVGSTVRARFQYSGDTDVFKVDLKAGVTYEVELRPSSGATDSTWIGLKLFTDTNPLFKEEYANAGNKARSSFTVVTSSEYFISAYGQDIVGDYVLDIRQAQDDFGSSVDSSGSLAIGESVRGAIEVFGDSDWFRVALKAGKTYNFVVEGGAGPALYDANGQPLWLPTQSYPGGTMLVWTPKTSGTYFLSVDGYAPNSPGYVLHTKLADADDHGATAATATTLIPGQSIQGKLEVPSDVDWLKVPVKANLTYTFTYRPGPEVLSDHVRGDRFQLVDASGEVLKWASNGDVESTLLYQAATDGEAYLAVSASTELFSYTVTAAVDGKDLYLAAPQTTAVLSPGGVFRSAIDFSGDVDWVKVELEGGKQYQFEMDGQSTTASNGGSQSLAIYGADGTLVSNNSSASFYMPLRYTFTPSKSGTYFVAAAMTGTGNYTLKAASPTVPFADTFPPHAGHVSGPLYSLPFDPRTDNIFVSFNEAIVRGSGFVTLRLETGELVERFDVASSNRLSFNFDDSTLIIDPSAPLAFATRYLVEIDAPAFRDKAGLPLAQPFTGKFSTAESPSQVATFGPDRYFATAKDDLFDGSLGTDTVVFQGPISSYTIRELLPNNLRVSDGQSTDALLNIERLVFSDGAVAFDIDGIIGVAGYAYRLYQASFNRVPDPGGLGFWIAQVDNGLSLRGLARGFIASDEFAQLYGVAPSNEAFIKALYNNVLHREPDAGGYAFWGDQLQKGTTREDLLLGFSSSPENVANVIGQVQHGIHYLPYA